MLLAMASLAVGLGTASLTLFIEGRYGYIYIARDTPVVSVVFPEAPTSAVDPLESPG